jgi:hypothetical protein
VFLDDSVDQVLHQRRRAGGLPGVERVLPFVYLALQPLGFLARRRDGPGGPRPDGQAALPPGGPVDQFFKSGITSLTVTAAL